MYAAMEANMERRAEHRAERRATRDLAHGNVLGFLGNELVARKISHATNTRAVADRAAAA